MKPILKKTDYQTIKNIIISGNTNGLQIDLRQLQEELANCKIVEDSEVPKNTVKIGSEIEVKDLDNTQVIKAKIVLPHQADLKEGKISILAPLAVALIGFKKGKIVTWQMPAGIRRLKILSVK
ncbi:GreA/GreB family elongation factor [Echinicola salinicaeni]|uniref:GreA/GreB family elongation factor n=1 Tax=Echinicola salinicaeni TaxID=2762757 RepID=UPI001646A830|nr:GreA/GreB family elongation factor [Echinicola salinicaeni]